VYFSPDFVAYAVPDPGSLILMGWGTIGIALAVQLFNRPALP
jgi:hypothetical protein